MSLKKRLNEYYRGRPDQKEFTDADLPETYPQLFRTVLSVRKREMVGVNLLGLLIRLPAILWTVINYVQLNALAGNANTQQLYDLLFSYLLVLFPLVTIAAPFNTGISFVMGRWARDEHSGLREDFFPAVRENWKQSLLFGFVNGAAPLVVFIGARIYAQFTASTAFFYLPTAVLLVIGLIWMLMAQIFPSLLTNYGFSFRVQFLVALRLTLRNLPLALGIRLLMLAFPICFVGAVLFFPKAEALLTTILGLGYALFWLSLKELLATSYANAVCEEQLNPHIDGARSRIGLKPKNN